MYPSYQNLDISRYFTSWGFYTLGYVRHHRPDIELIPLRFKNFNEHIEAHDKVNYDWLAHCINQALSQGKIVGLLPEDEHVAGPPNTQLTQIVNQVAEKSVYWLTQLDQVAHREVYHNDHGMRCRMLELPWCLLNDCLTYYRVRREAVPNARSQHNFLCMVNNQETHKMQLLTELHSAGLDRYGRLTLSRRTPGFEFCKINGYNPYSDVPEGCSVIGACTLIDNVWISKNVENFLYIEQTYNHIPLIINAETMIGQFMNTEKSIWPVLLGHLFLIWGRPGTMAWIQKFYDIDIESFANTEYDNICGNTLQEQTTRSLQQLLTNNQALIQSAADIKYQLQHDLQAARWTFGRNLYNFFVEQLKQIA